MQSLQAGLGEGKPVEQLHCWCGVARILFPSKPLYSHAEVGQSPMGEAAGCVEEVENAKVGWGIASAVGVTFVKAAVYVEVCEGTAVRGQGLKCCDGQRTKTGAAAACLDARNKGDHVAELDRKAGDV